jgi:hypothetical protein
METMNEIASYLSDSRSDTEADGINTSRSFLRLQSYFLYEYENNDLFNYKIFLIILCDITDLPIISDIKAGDRGMVYKFQTIVILQVLYLVHS